MAARRRSRRTATRRKRARTVARPATRRRRRKARAAVTRKRARRASAVAPRRRRRSRAPVAAVARRTRRKAVKGARRARRFAGRKAAGLVPTLKRAVPSILIGGVGFVGTRYLTGLALGDKDRGWMGYLGSAGVAVLGTLLLLKAKKTELAASFATGSGIGLALRIARDLAPQQMAPLGLSAVYPARGQLGAIRPSGMGAITPARFVA